MRLIDADTLTEELSSLTTTITGLRAGNGVLREFMTEYRKSVLRIVDEQPTIDAVPVRCKDCRWMKLLGNGYRYCTVWRCVNSLGNDGFCNYGERKDK